MSRLALSDFRRRLALNDLHKGALEAAAYLREEADFNRSWTDGRRRFSESPGYIARRLELAEQREAWAMAIEALVKRDSLRKGRAQ